MSKLIYASVNTIVRHGYTHSEVLDKDNLEIVFNMLWKSIVNV